MKGVEVNNRKLMLQPDSRVERVPKGVHELRRRGREVHDAV